MTRAHLILTMVIMCLISGCATVPEGESGRRVLNSEVTMALDEFEKGDYSFRHYMDDAYGYVVFPKVFKGAFWIGGAFGRGQVYEESRMIGYSSLSQATIGFSFGGEFFREVIFFNDKTALDRFKAGNFEFSAQASAVIADAGAGAKLDYRDGMAVIIQTDAGLMVDASIGGQKFKYVPR